PGVPIRETSKWTIYSFRASIRHSAKACAQRRIRQNNGGWIEERSPPCARRRNTRARRLAQLMRRGLLDLSGALKRFEAETSQDLAEHLETRPQRFLARGSRLFLL